MPKTAVTFRCLKQCDILMTQGKITGQDYYETLARLTDNSGVDPPTVSIRYHILFVSNMFHVQSKYEEFMRVVRLWQHLKILKRAAIAYRPGGLAVAVEGCAAVRCPACPRAYLDALPDPEDGVEVSAFDDIFILNGDDVRIDDGRVFIRTKIGCDEYVFFTGCFVSSLLPSPDGLKPNLLWWMQISVSGARTEASMICRSPTDSLTMSVSRRTRLT